MRVLVKCMHGIGDSLYARPFIKMLVADGHNVYLNTPLPFLYADLDLKFVKTKTPLRAQSRYLETSKIEFVDEPPDVEKTINYFYTHGDLKRHTIVSHLENAFGYGAGNTKPVFDLPALPPHGVELPTGRKIAVVRPVTHRREWLCTSRSPQPIYVP